MKGWEPIDRGNAPGQMWRHKSKSKRWRIRVYIGRGANDRQHYTVKTITGTKRDAEALIANLTQQKSVGTLVPRSKLTLTELAEQWLEHKRRDVSPRTLVGYEEALRRYALPSLGHRRIADLRLHDLDRVYGAMLSGDLPRPDGRLGTTGQPVGPRSVRMVHAALNMMLKQAVRWGYIAANPAAEASLPAHRPREKQPLTATERQRFLAACHESFYGVFYRLLVDTGLRPGEACALRWNDLDFARGSIAVQRAVTRGADGEAILAEPKTSKSRRTVPMLDGLRDELLKHLDWQRERNLDAAGFVFTNQEGRMLRPWTFSKRDLRRTLRLAGIAKPVSLYNLRHSFASLHVAAGTPLKVVSDMLGHATIQQTADTYMHGDQAVTADWMQRFERALDQAAAPAAPVN